MAVRPMVPALTTGDPAGMDEPTLDCSWCGGAGVAEYRIERLDDAAQWSRRSTWIACAQHLEYVALRVCALEHNDRIVVMRCG